MAKKISNKTMAARTVTMINQGSDVWLCAEYFGVSLSKIYRILREKYVYNEPHRKILEKSRKNRDARLKAEALANAQKEVTVTVTDTSFLMKNGTDWMSEHENEIFIPAFCIRELKNLAQTYKDAEEVLDSLPEERPTYIDLKGHEKLVVRPKFYVKPRTIGVVALAVYLCMQGYKVKLLSKSLDIQDLAEEQELDIEVVKTTGGEEIADK